MPRGRVIKYLVRPGYVLSRNDGDEHYIGARQLMGLYKVDSAECIVDSDWLTDRDREGLIILRPRYSGDYTCPDS